MPVAANQSVLIVTKDELAQSSSNYAQGGIAGVIDPEDRFEDHVSDTLNVGGSLCDPDIVEMVVREAPERIHELMQWGTQFDQQAGNLELGREGGHSRHRVVHAMGGRHRERGDAGHDSVDTAAEQRPHLGKHVYPGFDYGGGKLPGSPGCGRPRNHRTLVWSKQTILCTGGAGQLYRETTNPAVATADGHAIAFRAGAELRDMEFMQFHPTVLYIAGSSRSLITEAIRGEGGRLVDRTGKRFMTDYDERGELAPRDIVSQAIVTQMEVTSHPCVYLDLSHLQADFVRQRFPGICATCAKFGIDITQDRIPVRPGAHYIIGGVTVDAEGQTSLPGLWAAGEVGSSSLHGANRLASNSLLEGLVFGSHAGRGASRVAETDARYVPGTAHRKPTPTRPDHLLWTSRTSATH